MLTDIKKRDNLYSKVNKLTFDILELLMNMTEFSDISFIENYIDIITDDFNAFVSFVLFECGYGKNK